MKNWNKMTMRKGLSALFTFVVFTANCTVKPVTDSGGGIDVGTSPTVTYTGSPYIVYLSQDFAITSQLPTLTGDAPTACDSAPILPTGLSIDATTCAISGTPTTVQGATSYTITASNAYGNGTANISIEIYSIDSTWRLDTKVCNGQNVDITGTTTYFIITNMTGRIFNQFSDLTVTLSYPGNSTVLFAVAGGSQHTATYLVQGTTLSLTEAMTPVDEYGCSSGTQVSTWTKV
jgi:hypothetical protein